MFGSGDPLQQKQFAGGQSNFLCGLVCSPGMSKSCRSAQTLTFGYDRLRSTGPLLKKSERGKNRRGQPNFPSQPIYGNSRPAWYDKLASGVDIVLSVLTAILSLPTGSIGPQEPPPVYDLVDQHDDCPPLDSKDGQPVLIGPATSGEILSHRPEFSNTYEKVFIRPDWKVRWEKIDIPCTIVVVFGSWCADSYHWIPDLIKLSEARNPFVRVHWLGTCRDKATNPCDWPPQTIPQKTERVPTFWLFSPAPGGNTRLAGSIVENPPRVGQTMAEALLELLETTL